jgi:hypothetical protein
VTKEAAGTEEEEVVRTQSEGDTLEAGGWVEVQQEQAGTGPTIDCGSKHPLLVRQEQPTIHLTNVQRAQHCKTVLCMRHASCEHPHVDQP